MHFLNELEAEYSRLHFHKELQIDTPLKLQLFSYSQEYFSIDMASLIFPIRIFVKNVRNEGTLFVGYDRQFPGVQLKTPKEGEDDKNYDYKFSFTRDVMLVLKN